VSVPDPVDWLAWHQDYDDPASPLSRRRRVVQHYLRTALAEQPPGGAPGSVRLISLCAGDGVDVLEVLHSENRVRALLVELDPQLASRARNAAERLPEVEVVTGDAALTARYLAFGRAHVLVAVGVFGNIDEADLRRTIAVLPALIEPDGLLVWSRGRGAGERDASDLVRELLAGAGFAELDVTVPDDAKYRVGLHRLVRPAAGLTVPERLFRFR